MRIKALTTYQQGLANAGHCMADTDGDCSWADCPQEANGRANYQPMGCPRWIAMREKVDPDDEGRAGG